jgi:hypothetical protein
VTTPSGPYGAQRPATELSPAARLLWRSGSCVQLELGSRRVAVDGVAAPVVGELVGRRRSETAAALPATQRLQEQLVATGFLWPAGEPEDLRLAPPQPRLAAELVALTARHGDHAAEILSARRTCSVVVHGRNRVGPQLAAVLAAAGVGSVHVLDRGPVRLAQTAPGGIPPDEEGRPVAEAAERAILRAGPDTDTAPPPLGECPDLVILAVDEPIDPERRAALHARDCAHLPVSLSVDHGVIGPLVLPGLTSCLGCADLHRLDRDPAWNALAVQLSVPARTPPANDVALTTMLAGLAALEVLAFLDGGQPATIEGTLEMHSDDRRIRRRSWPMHPDCTCMVS